jgi:hypothetical protein
MDRSDSLELQRSAVTTPGPRRRAIGRIGTVARTLVGLGLVVLAVTVERGGVRDAVLGVIVLPATATLLLALRGRGSPPLRLGAAGHLVTIAIVLGLSLVFPPATVLLFYGSAMLLAAASRNGACEVTAVSNWLRGRDDQIGCPLFAPFDALDGRSGCAAGARSPTPRASSLSSARRTARPPRAAGGPPARR